MVASPPAQRQIAVDCVSAYIRTMKDTSKVSFRRQSSGRSRTTGPCSATAAAVWRSSTRGSNQRRLRPAAGFPRWIQRVGGLVLQERRAVTSVNGAHAHFSDASLLARLFVLLLQTKKYDSTKLLSYSAAAEAYKMGSRHWTSVLGHLVDEVSSDGVLAAFGKALHTRFVSGSRVSRSGLFEALVDKKIPGDGLQVAALREAAY